MPFLTSTQEPSLNEFVDSFFPREKKLDINMDDNESKKRKVVSIEQSDWTRNSWKRDEENSERLRKKRKKSISSKEIKQNKIFELPVEDLVYTPHFQF